MAAMQLLPGLRYTCSINEKSPGARGTSYLFLASPALAAVRGIKSLQLSVWSHIQYFHCPWCLFSTLIYCILHCFSCRPSDSTLSEDAGIEPRTVATSALLSDALDLIHIFLFTVSHVFVSPLLSLFYLLFSHCLRLLHHFYSPLGVFLISVFFSLFLARFYP